jgi:hypothetical protein
MRAFSTRRRYERALPVLLAIVFASSVTAVLAFLVFPSGNSDDNDDANALVTDADVGTATASGDQAEQFAGAAPPTSDLDATAASTQPPPTPTAREIRRPAPSPTPMQTPTPTPTSGPVLAERNLVANGDFGDGLNGWYLEGDVGVADSAGRNGSAAVRIGAGGGYIDEKIDVEAGRTYRLQAWANVSSGGEAVEVGILYSDTAGNRLQNEEPAALDYEQTTLTRKSIRFSPPENAAVVRVYVWKESGTAEFTVDDISVREFVTTG